MSALPHLPKASSHRRTLSSLSSEGSRSSSLQKLWAEDYYADTTPVNNTIEDILTPPEPATLTERPFPRSVPLLYDEERPTPRQPRTHHRSLTELLPFRISQKTAEKPLHHTPVKEKSNFDFMPAFTGDKRGVINGADKGKGGLGGWFSGSSAPVQLGAPVDLETIDISTSHDASPQRSQRRGTVSTVSGSPTTPKAPGSRFSFFSKTPTTQTVQIPSKLDDELLTLDITKALFPAGRAESDPFSPAAFKNLLVSAEVLLNKLQTAYQQRTHSLHELSCEKEAQAEELEEAEMRAKHLKLQLEDMARQIVEKDEELARVKADLVAEKKAREEERIAREKSISLLKFSHDSMPQDFEHLGPVDSSQSRRMWRASNGTIFSDTSFESDDDSAESVFSHSLSPALSSVSEMPSISSTRSSTSTPEVAYAKMITVRPATVDALSLQPAQRPKPVQQRSTFQKILKGITAPSSADSENGAAAAGPEDYDDSEEQLGLSEQGCRNCRGLDSSVAWDTVGLLRLENKGLKERVQTLDRVVEGALDIVAGVGVPHA